MEAAKQIVREYVSRNRITNGQLSRAMGKQRGYIARFLKKPQDQAGTVLAIAEHIRMPREVIMQARARVDELNLLLSTIAQLEPPPCETCENLARCRAEQLACKSFHFYTYANQPIGRKHPWGEQPREPSAEWFNHIFSTAEEECYGVKMAAPCTGAVDL